MWFECGFAVLVLILCVWLLTWVSLVYSCLWFSCDYVGVLFSKLDLCFGLLLVLFANSVAHYTRIYIVRICVCGCFDLS